jgi:hypothetical protein
MNDEELPINAELASAYLDNELDPAERASVSADPHVMSMVDSFSRVRAILGDAEPVEAGSRSTAIAAALAEFDARHAPSLAGPIVAPATIMSLQSRRLRAYRVLTGVAAALLIGVVAVAALNASRGNDAKSSSASENTTSAAADSNAAVPPQLKAAPAGTAAPTDAGGTSAAAGAPSVESASAGGPEIDSRDALKEYAADLRTGQAAPAPAATQYGPSCLTSDQIVLGPIVFQGKAAYAVRKQSTGVVQAVDATDCQVLADAAP